MPTTPATPSSLHGAVTPRTPAKANSGSLNGATAKSPSRNGGRNVFLMKKINKGEASPLLHPTLPTARRLFPAKAYAAKGKGNQQKAA